MDTARALEKIMEAKFDDFIPEIDPKEKVGFRYPLADELLETRSDDTNQTLDRLANEGLLVRFPFDKLMACPNCKSFNPRVSTSCPHCSHTNMTRGRVLDHMLCGYVGPESEFISSEGYTCPKCRRTLKLIGADYRSPGLMYKCESCGKVSLAPRETFICFQCNHRSSLEELAEIPLFGYRLSAAARTHTISISVPKAKLVDWLKSRGYEVSIPGRVIGKSNVKHRVDILAEKYSKGGFLADRIFIDFYISERETSADPILSLFAKGMDTEISRLLLIVVPKLSKNASLFAKMYNIEVYEGSTLEEAIVKIFAQAPDASKWLLGR